MNTHGFKAAATARPFRSGSRCEATATGKKAKKKKPINPIWKHRETLEPAEERTAADQRSGI